MNANRGVLGESMEDHNTWLGKDLKTWSQSVRSGYARAFILFALHNTGVFEALRRAGAQTANELAESCNVEADLLEGVLNFLYIEIRLKLVILNFRPRQVGCGDMISVDFH